MREIYTIGHSNHSSDEFIALLQAHNIQALVDVRSQPFSRYNPHFNRENLSVTLRLAQIHYTSLGNSLGGRPKDESLYDEGSERPDYQRQRQTAHYQQGLQRLVDLAQTQNTAMMCSEGDPDTCHRTLLITPSLIDLEFTVHHILPDGKVRLGEKPTVQLGFGF